MYRDSLPRYQINFSLLPLELFMSLDRFDVSCLVFGDISRRDFCLLSNIMGLNGALNVVLTAPKNTFEKLISDVSFQKSPCYTK